METSTTDDVGLFFAEWKTKRGALGEVHASVQRGQDDDGRLAAAANAALLALFELKTALARAGWHEVPEDLRRDLRRFREETRGLSLPNTYPIERADLDPFLGGLIHPMAWAELDESPPYAEGVLNRAVDCEPLIVAEKIHPRLALHLATARRCYVVGLHDAAVVFCHSLIEVAVFDFLNARNDLPRVYRIENRGDGLAHLLGQLKSYRQIPAAALDKAHQVRKAGNDALHSTDGSGPALGDKAALEVIEKTVAFLERLNDHQ